MTLNCNCTPPPSIQTILPKIAVRLISMSKNDSDVTNINDDDSIY